MESPVVELRNLSFRRGERVIFDGVDLTIPRGKVVAIMGPSGSGKTTMLKLIGGQLTPDAGTVRLQLTDEGNQLLPPAELSQLTRAQCYALRRYMGMLFQASALFTNLSVFDNVAFPLREHTRLSARMIHDMVLMKLEAVGLRGAWRRMPSELSGGMARRVALARALALDPPLMMYDEPFTGLDPITMAVIVKLIKELNDALGLTSIIVSHDIAETAKIADYIYIIADGKVIGQGSPEVLMQSAQPMVHQFVRGVADGVVPFHYPAPSFKEELLS